MNIAELFTAFGAGLLTFLSPCVLPLIPVYICLITGLSFNELTGSKGAQLASKKLILTEALFFIFGFSFVFVALGASASFLGSFLSDHMRVFRIIGGSVLVIFGIHLIGIIKIPFLEREKRFQVKSKSASSFGSLLAGVAFGLGWTPCVGPILGGILVMAAARETLLQGVILLSAYSLGIALPLLLVSIGVHRAVQIFSKVKKYFRVVKIVSGVLLITIGINLIFRIL
jgi:cytochrome c-type biogenesis protein